MALVTALAHVKLDVADLNASLRFYLQLLGFVERARHEVPRGVVVHCGPASGGAGLELRHEPDRQVEPNVDYHFCLDVPDVRVALDTLEAEGVFVLQRPLAVGERIIAFVLDPDGHVIELNSAV